MILIGVSLLGALEEEHVMGPHHIVLTSMEMHVLLR